MTKRHRLSLSLTERTEAQLKYLCEHYQETASPMIRQLIDDKYNLLRYFQKQEEKLKQDQLK